MSGLDIEVSVTPEFRDAESSDSESRYVFSYTVTVHNQSPHSVRLMARYWKITQGSGDSQEVRGKGVVGQQVARSSGTGDFVRRVLGQAEVGDALRKAQCLRAAMVTKAPQMRALDIAHATVFLVGGVEGKPQGQSVAGFEHEVLAILVGRGRLASGGWFVEVLEILADDFFPEQLLGEAAWLVVEEFAEEGVVVVEPLDLLERAWIGLVLMEDLLGRQVGKTCVDEASERGLDGGGFFRAVEAGYGHEAVPFERILAGHGLGWSQSR